MNRKQEVTPLWPDQVDHFFRVIAGIGLDVVLRASLGAGIAQPGFDQFGLSFFMDPLGQWTAHST